MSEDQTTENGLKASRENSGGTSTVANSQKRIIQSRLVRRLALLPLVAIASLYFLSMTSSYPDNLGAENGKLGSCPTSPNCVSTQTDQADKKMEPIPFEGEVEEIKTRIKSVAESFPRSRLVSENENYLHFEFKSLIFRFVDDVEFLVDDESSVVHFRSASRVGHSDLGANRKRMQSFCERVK